MAKHDWTHEDIGAVMLTAGIVILVALLLYGLFSIHWMLGVGGIGVILALVGGIIIID